MARRALTSILWFYSVWYLGALTAFLLGLPGVIGPILGIAAGTLVAIDPRGVLWARRSSRPEGSEPLAISLPLPSEG